MENFRHNRVLFAGDAAHQVSPFGARGANSGIQDSDNLAWKLDLVLNGDAPETLLDSYHEERAHGADENILNSTRATDFLTPKSDISKTFRNAVLTLAKDHAFARPMVNSGRLSVPCVYDASSLNGDDALQGGPAQTRVGSACKDAPVGDGFLLRHLGDDFVLLAIDADAPDTVEVGGITVRTVRLSTSDDPTGALAQRYLGDARHAVYLIRPDQHVTARWATYDADSCRAAVLKSCAKG